MPLTETYSSHSAGSRKDNSGRSCTPSSWLEGSWHQPGSEWTLCIVVTEVPVMNINRAIPGNPKSCWKPGQGVRTSQRWCACSFEISLPKTAPLIVAEERKAFSRCHRTSITTSQWAVSFRTTWPCKQMKNQQTAFLHCSDMQSSLCISTSCLVPAGCMHKYSPKQTRGNACYLKPFITTKVTFWGSLLTRWTPWSHDKLQSLSPRDSARDALFKGQYSVFMGLGRMLVAGKLVSASFLDTCEMLCRSILHLNAILITLKCLP